jgi:Heat shock protein
MKRNTFLILFALIVLFSACKQKENLQKSYNKAPIETLELTQTQWHLIKIGAMKPKLIREDQSINIVFDKDNLHFAGFSGCNRYFGNFNKKKSSIKLENIGATKMDCPENDMSIENKYLPLLDKVDNYTIHTDTLFLSQGIRILLTFIAKG